MRSRFDKQPDLRRGSFLSFLFVWLNYSAAVMQLQCVRRVLNLDAGASFLLRNV